jgi:hypothetical protein
LLDEDRQLRGLLFSEVIGAVTSKKVIPFDRNNEVDQRVAKAISAALDETLKRMNARARRRTPLLFSSKARVQISASCASLRARIRGAGAPVDRPQSRWGSGE